MDNPTEPTQLASQERDRLIDSISTKLDAFAETLDPEELLLMTDVFDGSLGADEAEVVGLGVQPPRLSISFRTAASRHPIRKHDFGAINPQPLPPISQRAIDSGINPHR